MTSSTQAESDTRRPLLPSLTGLRFVAALCVVLEHLNVISPFLPPGRIAVSFFFVLSGFVLTWSMGTGDTRRSFWRRRFWKIFPNHVATWVVMMAFLGLTGVSLVPQLLSPGPTPLGPALANLFLVHAWVPSFPYLLSVSPVSWSLCSEVLFYALFPFIATLVGRIPINRLKLAAVALVALVWLIPLVSLTFGGDELFPGLFMSQYWFDYFFPPARLPEFVIGIVLARLVMNGFTPRVTVALPGIGVMVFLIAGAFGGLPNPFLFVAVTIIPVSLVVLGAASMDVRSARSIWRHRSMVFLGEISYALYLVHVPVIQVFEYLAGDVVTGAIGGVATTTISVGLSVLAAWGLYRAVERPLMSRFGRRARSAPSTPVRTSV